MKRSTGILAVTAFLLGIASGGFVVHLQSTNTGDFVTPPRHPVWTEIAWPFPIDQWGRGKAFRCSVADCGTEVNVYVRAKIGFCNCTTGVSDDQELDRISDYDLIGGELTPLGPGRPINVAWMKGRSRSFAIVGARTVARSAISVGFNDHCDAIIATATLGHDQPGIVEESIISFLNSKPLLHWAEVTLGL